MMNTPFRGVTAAGNPLTHPSGDQPSPARDTTRRASGDHPVRPRGAGGDRGPPSRGAVPPMPRSGAGVHGPADLRGGAVKQGRDPDDEVAGDHGRLHAGPRRTRRRRRAAAAAGALRHRLVWRVGLALPADVLGEPAARSGDLRDLPVSQPAPVVARRRRRPRVAAPHRRRARRARQLLRAESLPVLEVLRFETEALLLRTRIVADTVRQTRATRTEEVA